MLRFALIQYMICFCILFFHSCLLGRRQCLNFNGSIFFFRILMTDGSCGTDSAEITGQDQDMLNVCHVIKAVSIVLTSPWLIADGHLYVCLLCLAIISL